MLLPPSYEQCLLTEYFLTHEAQPTQKQQFHLLVDYQPIPKLHLVTANRDATQTAELSLPKFSLKE